MRSIYFDTNIHTLDNAQDSNDFANKSSCIFQYVVFPPQWVVTPPVYAEETFASSDSQVPCRLVLKPGTRDCWFLAKGIHGNRTKSTTHIARTDCLTWKKKGIWYDKEEPRTAANWRNENHIEFVSADREFL